MGTPHFSCPHAEQQFDIRAPVVIVFVLCISSDSVILRLVSVLYYVMVEKAETFRRPPTG